ncbi:MAG: hypothetical protein MSA49_01330 [Clostridia bacterium]|nr:hypothetical protein [Clostridia bacterium]
MKIYYIAGGEMHSFDTDTQASSYISSPVLEDYRKRVRENAKRNEWKHAGSGAAFLSEGGEKALSPEEAVMQIRAGIHALYVTEDAMDYALSIDDICGIYKHRPKEAQDGIIISDSNMRYTFFAKEPKSGRLAVCCEFAGEIHLGLLLPGENHCSLITEGLSRERWPSWSEKVPDRLWFSECGLAASLPESDRKKLKSYPQMVLDSLSQQAYTEGPFSISRFDTQAYEMIPVLSDPKQRISYIKPHEAQDGFLYYIKKPYENGAEKSGRPSIGDILLAPFRLIGALFGFMNFFTMKYSGKTLTKSGGASKAKHPSEADLWIDGNLFHAEKEAQKNAREGDKHPGAIPRSYVLCRCPLRDGSPAGPEEIIRRGIIAYHCLPDGSLLCSNGTYLLKLTPAGDGHYKETVLLKERAVSFITTQAS